jgi:molecular chaperone DnaJ
MRLRFRHLTEKVKLKIPAGTQTGTFFRLKGKGVPRLRGNGQGDQHVRVIVVTPSKLNDEQKELLRQFAPIMERTRMSRSNPSLTA